MRVRRAYSAVIEGWRRRSMVPKHVLMRRVGAVAVAYVIGSIVVGKLTWGSSGPSIVTPFAFAALFLAAVALTGVAIIHSQDLVDEMEASHPPRVRNRGGFVRSVKPLLATFRSAFREWRVSAGSTLRREVTRGALVRRSRALARSLSGVPPAGVSPVGAGRLARPIAAPRASGPVRVGARKRTALPPLMARRQARASLARRPQPRRRRGDRVRTAGNISSGSTKPTP
jgi:hypothetical protein